MSEGSLPASDAEGDLGYSRSLSGEDDMPDEPTRVSGRTSPLADAGAWDSYRRDDDVPGGNPAMAYGYPEPEAGLEDTREPGADLEDEDDADDDPDEDAVEPSGDLHEGGHAHAEDEDMDEEPSREDVGEADGDADEYAEDDVGYAEENDEEADQDGDAEDEEEPDEGIEQDVDEGDGVEDGADEEDEDAEDGEGDEPEGYERHRGHTRDDEIDVENGMDDDAVDEADGDVDEADDADEAESGAEDAEDDDLDEDSRYQVGRSRDVDEYEGRDDEPLAEADEEREEDEEVSDAEVEAPADLGESKFAKGRRSTKSAVRRSPSRNALSLGSRAGASPTGSPTPGSPVEGEVAVALTGDAEEPSPSPGPDDAALSAHRAPEAPSSPALVRPKRVRRRPQRWEGSPIEVRSNRRVSGGSGAVSGATGDSDLQADHTGTPSAYPGASASPMVDGDGLAMAESSAGQGHAKASPVPDEVSTASVRSVESGSPPPEPVDPIEKMHSAVRRMRSPSSKREVIEDFHAWQLKAISSQANYQKALHNHLRRKLRRRLVKVVERDRVEDEALRNACRMAPVSENDDAEARRKTKKMKRLDPGIGFVPEKVRLPLEAYIPRRVCRGGRCMSVEDLMTQLPSPPVREDGEMVSLQVWVPPPEPTPSANADEDCEPGDNRAGKGRVSADM